MVSRLVPEKRQDDLMEAFLSAKMKGWKLVLVGSTTPMDKYIDKIEKLAKKSKDIILTGFLTGQPLEELYANAGCFVLPSSHEGNAYCDS
jgi:glycosyltransferase involved in cell wall biosynthesis